MMTTMKKIFVFAIIALLSICCNREVRDKGNGPEEYAFKGEEASLTLTKAEEVLVTASNEFGFSLASRIQDENFVFSPLSATILLGMLEEGADGQTAAQISRVLGFGDAGREQINSFCRNMIVISDKGEENVVKIANALILNQQSVIKDDYLKAVTEYYDALAVNMDFSSETTLDYINGWAREKTNGLIPKILEQLKDGAFAYLMNALYFKGTWHKKFYSNEPDSDFFSADGNVKKVKMLKQQEAFNYVETDDVRAVNMLYKGADYDMTVILPAEGKATSDIIQKLGGGLFDRIRDSWKGTDVVLSIPEFELSSKIMMKELLKDMGMIDAFGDADFSRMTPRQVMVADIFQKAKINVDENGTEAAAVTVAEIVDSAAPIPSEEIEPVIFTADHPFIFTITERTTGAILFIGVYAG